MMAFERFLEIVKNWTKRIEEGKEELSTSSIKYFKQQLNEEYKRLKPIIEKQKLKTLERLKKIERKVYDEELQMINTCETWEEFCEYATDDPDVEPFVYILDNDEGYVIIHDNYCPDFIEIVDLVCLTPPKIFKLLSKVVSYCEKVNCYTLYADTNKKVVDFVYALTNLGYVKIIFLNYNEDEKQYSLKFEILTKEKS